MKRTSTRISAKACMSASAFALAAVASGGALAQLDEITVTAQKTEQSLQEVPLAVSVLNSEAVENAFAIDFEGLQTLVPSVSFRKGSTNANSAITIRGIGTISFSDAAEPSVSTVVDGVVLGRSGQAFGDLFDIERIEVLRGPQGTLFGKNASAGVVNIITRRPSTEEYEGYVSASYFEDEEYRVKARVSGPINDDVAFSLVVNRSEFDGFLRNVFNNRDVNGYDRWGGRAQVLWTPFDDGEVLFTYEHSEGDDDCCTDIEALPSGRNPASPAAPNSQGIIDQGPGNRPFADIDLDQRLIDHDFETRTINNTDAFSVEINKDIWSGITFTSITAFREWSNTELREGDFTSIGGTFDEPVFGVPFQLHDVGTRDHSQFTQEFRFKSPDDSPLNWQLGAYYFALDIESDFTREASCQNNGGQNQPILDANPGLTCNSNDIVSATSFSNTSFDNFALFGQADYDILEGLNVLFGFRFTNDNVSFVHTRRNNDEFGRQGVGVRPREPNSQFGPASGGFDTVNQGETEVDDFSIKAGVNADLGALIGNDRNLGNAYFVYSQGYKGPAFNVFFNQGFNDIVPIAEETSDHFEIGYKLALPSFLLNVALYNTDIEGFQANAFDNSTGVTITRLTNAGDVRTRGVEVDAVWSPIENLQLTAAFAYNDAEIVAFNSPIDPTTGLPESAGIFEGVDLLFSPDFNYTLGANYQFPISETMDFFINTTFSHVDEQESLLPSGDGTNPFPIPPQSLLPSYNLWDLAVGLSILDDKYRVTGIVNNLLDESFVTTNSGDGFRFQTSRDAERYFGVNFRANF